MTSGSWTIWRVLYSCATTAAHLYIHICSLIIRRKDALITEPRNQGVHEMLEVPLVLLPVGVDHVLEEHVGKFSGGVSESLSDLLAIESGKMERIFLTLFFRRRLIVRKFAFFKN